MFDEHKDNRLSLELYPSRIVVVPFLIKIIKGGLHEQAANYGFRRCVTRSLCGSGIQRTQ
jgi:hypothetical protein